ncbi:RNA polymerase sigma factor [Pseudomonas phage vB_PpuM-Voja-6]
MAGHHQDVMSWMKQNNPYDLTLTSAQMFGLLDDLIGRALLVIFQTTLIADEVVATTMSWQMMNKRRKLSSFSRGDVVSLMAGFLSVKDPQEKLTLFFDMQLERTMYHAIIEAFLERTEGYDGVCLELASATKANYHTLVRSKSEIEASVRYTGHRDLWSARRQVIMWYGLANELRKLIAKKYSRWLFSKVRKEVTMSKIKVDINDMAQNYMLATLRAINKYKVSKGTFTSYLEFWVKDAKTSNEFNHYLGLAYYVPSVEAVEGEGQTNLYTGMDDPSVEEVSVPSYEEAIVEQNSTDRIYQLCVYADPVGYARSAFNLD